ncbi:hypothetical protein RV09_GL000779 [Enterococcus moraviensis]|nr:hypothetical protein RV09_GL000779 [Enterococcus moraviensis]
MIEAFFIVTVIVFPHFTCLQKFSIEIIKETNLCFNGHIIVIESYENL